MNERLRRAGRLLARVAALIILLLLVGGLALRLWVHHRIGEAGEAFLEAFGAEATSDAPGPSDEDGGPWLLAAALVIQLGPDEDREIDAWARADTALSAADAQRLERWLERDRLALELAAAAARRYPIRLFTDPDRVELERMGLLPQAQSLGRVTRLFLAEELVLRSRADSAGACSCLERVGRLALGLQGGNYLLEQRLAELPERLFFARLQTLLERGDPLPCAQSLAELVRRLDPVRSTRDAMIQEGRWMLRPQRLLVLPANDRARVIDLVSLLFSNSSRSLIRADLLDAIRATLAEDRSSPWPEDRAPGATYRDFYRVLLRLAEVEEGTRRVALAALALRLDLQSGEDPGRSVAAAVERDDSARGESISIRASGPGAWALELDGADSIVEELKLSTRSARLLRWIVVVPRPASP